MKKTLFGISALLIFFTFLIVPAFGQTASPSSSISEEDEAIDILKEKVANSVIKTRKENNKAISGWLIEKKDETLKIKNEGLEYEVKLDDALTKYFRIQGTGKKEIETNDLAENDYLIVTGVENDKTVVANTIFVDERLLVFSGKITQVDKENYMLKIVTNAKEEIDLDIENSTKQSMINIKNYQIEQSGFSKIKEGDTISFVVTASEADKKTKYSAKKILIIPQEYFLK